MKEVYKRCTLSILRCDSVYICRIDGIASDIITKQDDISYYNRNSKSLLMQFKQFRIENVIYYPNNTEMFLSLTVFRR